MEASAKEGVLFGTFCLKCMQRELEYISKANALVYENLCDKQLLGVCVCEALGERKLPYGVY